MTKGKADVGVDVPPNTFQIGSRWIHPVNATELLTGTLNSMSLGNYSVLRNDGDGLLLKCALYDRKMTVKEVSEKCSFDVRCKRVDGVRVIRVKTVCLQYTQYWLPFKKETMPPSSCS